MNSKFYPLSCALLTISENRNLVEDKPGEFLLNSLLNYGHTCITRLFVKDSNVYEIRKILSNWIFDPNVHVVLTTGSTGYGIHDVAYKAIFPLLDKFIAGFGELFRSISYKYIGSSTIQSGAFAGSANQTLIFCLPGSMNACETAWNHLLSEQLDSTHAPCNFSTQLQKTITM